MPGIFQKHRSSHQVHFLVEEGEGNRSLLSYLQSVKGISVKAVKKLKHQGKVTVNGDFALLKSTVQTGDRITLYYPPEQASFYLKPEALPLEIVFEDDDIVVLNKKAGVCVHPTKAHPKGTIANGLLYHWAKCGEECWPHFVNRLDKDTSGLVLVAKNTFCAQQLFSRQLQGDLRRQYLALLSGYPGQDRGVIDLPLERVSEATVKREVTAGGRAALTRYSVLKRIPGYSLVAVSLETGRTHQIRVHFSHLGCPLVGDILYGGETGRLFRQFLHAYYLSFCHPVLCRNMEFYQDVPQDLADCWRDLAGADLDLGFVRQIRETGDAISAKNHGEN